MPVELESLITQLGASDWKLREAAQTLIVAVGEPAVARMKQVAAESTEPEVQERAHEILRQIAARTHTRPSLVTLRFKEAPARQVYESLYAQAGAKLVAWPDNLFEREAIAPVTIDLDKVPFWRAIDALEAQTGLTMTDRARDMALARADMHQRGGQVYISGPFRVVADDFGAGMIHRLTVFVEPRLRVLGHAHEPELDGADNDMRRGFRDHMMSGGNAFDVHISGGGRREKLRGTIRATIMSREQKVEIDDIATANNVEKKVDGMRFMVNAMEAEPGDWVITLIAYKNDPAGALQQLKATLLDEQGHELSLGGHGSSGSEKRVAFQMNFLQRAGCGEPKKMILQIPLQTEEIKIPFEFTARDPRGLDR